MTFVLQPVDASVVRSLNAAFGRLLVNQVLFYIIKLKEADNPVFKVATAITVYDA